MRKVVQFMHVSLDGFAAGPNGELDFANVDAGLFDFVSDLIKDSDAALYGRKTWELMEGYWPTADQKPTASKHEREHAPWYRSIDKYVLSNTLKSDPSKKLHVLGNNLVREIGDLKKGGDKNVAIFGSPSATHSLARLGLVDECWLFINPILLGKGIPAFDGQKEITKMKLVESQTFKNGVIFVNYQKI